ncbi:quinolinate synthase NadA [Haloimpatiens sp. FM7330]|uniref:quinolinate synthase NadA n=1 Tax=Haloimpatiens sp. FM7330 TaxID=3298610 RepID=UPI003640EC8C
MDLKKEILRLKEEKNAIVLAHYYQRDEVKDIADKVGDSFYLSRAAKNCSQDVIVFCGVKFMAESAKILSPQKKVLLTEHEALCPMAAMANAKDVEEIKKKYPNAKVVCYINSTAEVKSVSDVCCTSSNAVKIVENLDGEEIIFLPDENLGQYVQKQVPHKKIILWNGFCCVHYRVESKDVLDVKNKYKGAKILVHPECSNEVRNLADFIGSTGQIINYFNDTDFEKYIVVTEKGVIHEMGKLSKRKKIIPIESMTCVNMKKTTLKSVYESLIDMKYEINLNEDVINKAKNSLENMLILGR